MLDSNRRTGFKLPLSLRARQGVAISWYRVAKLHNPPGDSQKVNCPEGAREATLGCIASLLGMTS